MNKIRVRVLPVVEAGHYQFVFQHTAHIISDTLYAAGHNPVIITYNAPPHSVIAFPSAYVVTFLTRWVTLQSSQNSKLSYLPR